MSNGINQMAQGLLGKIAENSSAGAKKVGVAGASAPANAAKPAADGTSGRPAGETVELTSSAQLLERLEKTLASLPEIDRARVDAVKAAIENGEYESDAERIAPALHHNESTLGG